MKKIQIYALCFGLIFFAFILFFEFRREAETNILNYPSNINAILVSKKIGKTRGARLCLFNNSEKMEIGAIFKNNTIEKNGVALGSFLKIGDSISKKQGSDSVFVYRGEKEYVFIQTYFPNKN